GGIRVRKTRKVAALACVTALAALGLAACGDSGGGGGGKEGGSINGTVTSFPDYLDPQLSYTLEGWEGLWNTYVPLLTYAHGNGDETTKVVPGLAEALPDISADGKTYTLTLRKGMKYSDGTPIKASDFPYAIQRLFKLDSGGAPFYENIVGATDYADGKADTISGIKTDDATGKITIQLEKPSGTFENELGLMFAAPVPQSTPLDKDQTNTPPPSSGPFMISKSDPPNSYTLERNPQFKTVLDAGADIPDAHVDSLTVTQNKNQSAQAQAIQQNSSDFMVDPPPADLLPQIESQYSDRFRFQDSINTYYFWMNYKQPPFNDVRVRQAVNYAIDPAALTRIFGGRLHPSQQILPPGMPGYQEYKLYPGPDLDKAKALLAQAKPSDMDITVWTDDEPDRKRIGAYYQDVLNQLGFRTTLKIISGDVYFTTIGNLSTPDLDTGFADWFQDYPHPNDFFEPLLSGDAIHPTNNNNFGQVDIPELTKEINDLDTKQLSDVEDQYAELDKKFMEQAVWAPYGNERFTTFTSDRVNFDNVDFSLLFNLDYSSFQLKD
ncbi:MAG TPA: ABC transporter substrate-binding protein, partial [Gemmatimonadales bacterium]|nr:ABC transporter substrate-binding protein [Gemmatimonadales bacterium]